MIKSILMRSMSKRLGKMSVAVAALAFASAVGVRSASAASVQYYTTGYFNGNPAETTLPATTGPGSISFTGEGSALSPTTAVLNDPYADYFGEFTPGRSSQSTLSTYTGDTFTLDLYQVSPSGTGVFSAAVSGSLVYTPGAYPGLPPTVTVAWSNTSVTISSPITYTLASSTLVSGGFVSDIVGTVTTPLPASASAGAGLLGVLAVAGAFAKKQIA
jgi:predicted RNA-binding protein with TRAM domain